MDHFADILAMSPNSTHYYVIFAFVYAITVAYVLTYLVKDKNIDMKENQLHKVEETEQYENDSDDNSSVESEQENDFEEKEVCPTHCDCESESKEEYPELHKIFSKLSRNQLIKIVGKVYKNEKKSVLIGHAIQKFKSYTIKHSIQKFSHFPKYIKANVFNHEDQCMNDLNKLFGNFVLSED